MPLRTTSGIVAKPVNVGGTRAFNRERSRYAVANPGVRARSLSPTVAGNLFKESLLCRLFQEFIERGLHVRNAMAFSRSRSLRMASQGDTAVDRALQADRIPEQALLGQSAVSQDMVTIG